MILFLKIKNTKFKPRENNFTVKYMKKLGFLNKMEIDLLKNYPKSKRNLDEREKKTDEERK